MKKRILSVFIAMLFVMNCFPLSVIAEFEENIDLIEVFLENDFADNINVDDKEYDGELTAAVDCKNVKLINAHTSEEINGYNIWLEANGEFESKGASDKQKKVTVSGFRLEGDDRDKFKLVGEYDVVEKYAYITPSEISLDEGFETKIKVNDKEFDGNRIANVDCSGVLDLDIKYNIFLAADGEFENANASDEEQKVIIKNFRLEGDDKDNFKLVGEYNEIEKYAYINPAKIFLDEGFENKIKVNSKEFDGNKTAEVDCSEVLNIDRSEYNVYLAADGEFENENVSNKPQKVIIKNFRLEGTDKDNFNLIGDYNEVVKYVNINPKELIVTPNEKSIYYGQQRPKFTYTIEPSDINNVNLTVDVNCSDHIIPIGNYNYTVKSEDSNYSARIADNCVFTVKAFNTDKRAIIENESEVYHDNIIKLEAPLGYLIGVDGVDFNTETYVTLQETQNEEKKEFSYYLRYNVNDSSGYYGAISQNISYEYSCVLDKKEPTITYINIRKTEIGSSVSDAPIKMFPFGNYTNNEIEFIIKAKDLSNSDYVSGIKSVHLYDYDEKTDSRTFIGEFEKKDSQTIDDEEIWEYVLKIQPSKIGNANVSIKDMLICVTDNKNNEYSKRVIDEINLHFENDSDNSPDEYLRTMESNSLIVENNPPEVNFDTSGSSAIEENEEEKIYWYNRDGGILTVNINDDKHSDGICSGICRVKITDEHDSIIDTLHSETFTENQENAYNFPIDVLTLSDGIHYINVETEDNAGNNCDPYPTVIVIGVDRKGPTGTISADGSSAKKIDDQQWFDSDDDITFWVDAIPGTAKINNVTLWINGEEKNYSKGEIGLTEKGYFITINKEDIGYGNEHKYEVTGKITDYANNIFDLKPYNVYIDCENPSINKFTVEKESSALDKILNVLSFGIYSNDTLIFKAYVSDADFDSGIKCVKIIYDGLEEETEMTDEGNGIYSWIISNDTKIFQSDIIVTAYDKYDKKSMNCPNIENAEQGKGVSDNVFVMIETIEPEVNINNPKGDGIVRTDKQTWFNSNKDISISVYDKDSGIRNVDIKVNGIDVTADKNGVVIPKISATESAKERDNERHIYAFDTDYFTGIAGEPEDGKYTITVEATDNAGNVPKDVKSFTYYIDKNSPNVDHFEFLPETSDNISETSEYIEHLEYGYYFKKDFIANIHISDSAPSSGLNKAEYRLVSYDDGELKKEKTGETVISDGIAPIDIPAGFKGQIFVKASDNVGNYSDEETPKAFVADDIPPEINISGIGDSRYGDANGNKLFTDDIAVTVTITDTKSGIREIGYYQTSESDGFERRALEIDGTSVEIDSEIGDGWVIVNKDVNLVTEITKTFTFDKDNNDITLVFDAMDNSGNVNEIVQSETFTVDKTAPIINVDINNGINDTIYYNAGNRAVITIDVIERNFDAGLIQASIENAYNGNIPNISFQDLSATEHRAVVTFSEGDYTFDIRGTDLGGHSAEVNLDYEKVRRFYVDETPPVVEENFSDFIDRDKDNYLNTEKTAVIKITEHNFDPNLVGLKILKKDAGTEHNENDFTDVTYSMVSMADWSDDNDMHTLSIKFDYDAVYRIEISPSDPSGNTSDYRSSEVFEIDTTIPVVSAKNGSFVDKKNAVEFLDIYPYDRKDEAVPTVEFTDVNFDYIKYVLTVYTPEYTNGKELSEVKPVSVYLDSDKDKSGIFEKNLFTLPDFSKDGVYALELIAVDKAGNESILNSNTYMRMVESDVLAYISNSNATEKTGWYSFQYENGDPISKRPDNFSDIDIVVLAKNDSDIDIVLRDYNGDEKNTDLTAEIDNSMYGVNVYRYTLKSDYFKDNFQDDTDAELYLSVKNENGRIDLGKMHIDNIPPSCNLPDDLKTWHWYFGDDSRTISVTNISELLDETKCKVYDNGKEIDFIYSETDGSLSFTLNGGWHNVGITLEDVAGNTYSIQEVDNIHIGYFWLWIIIIASVVFIGIIILIIYFVRKKRYS